MTRLEELKIRIYDLSKEADRIQKELNSANQEIAKITAEETKK
jgi:hypothetical protein